MIAGAGMAAHLAGALASPHHSPCHRCSIKSGALNGADALYSTVQMPPGVPVATVGIDGAKNAAYLACEILSIKYPEIAKKLEDFRSKTKKSWKKNRKLEERKPNPHSNPPTRTREGITIFLRSLTGRGIKRMQSNNNERQ